MFRNDDRLNAEEAAAVARLHAERAAEQEAAEQVERERLATTTAPEDLAAMIGASPEEVRALADEVRRCPAWTREASPAVRAADGRGRRRLLLSATALALVLGGSVLWPLVAGPQYLDPPESGAGYGDQIRTPVWDPYNEAYRREHFGGFGPGTVAVVGTEIVAPPPGFAIRLSTPVGVFLAAGPPASADALAPTESGKRLESAIRSLARHVEGTSELRGRIPYLVFPGKVPFEPGIDGYSGAAFVGWHAVTVENSAGKSAECLLPDRRYVRPQDLAGYEQEMERRLRWVVDGKTVAATPVSMRYGATTVRVAERFPQGVTLCAIGHDAKFVARGDGPATNAGAHIEAALRELAARAYVAGGRRDGSIRALLDAPGEAMDFNIAPGAQGLPWVREAMDRAFARPRPKPFVTHR